MTTFHGEKGSYEAESEPLVPGSASALWGATSSGGPVVIKLLYQNDQISPDTERIHRLRGLLATAEILSTIAAPIDYLRDDSGYVMNRAPGRSLNEAFLSTDERPSWMSTLSSRLFCALQVAMSAESLERNDLGHGDLSLNNILVDEASGTPRVTLVDLDTVFRLSEGSDQLLSTGGYAAPEVLISGGSRSTYSERFSLAVVLHYIILNIHPGGGSIDVSEDLWTWDAEAQRRLKGLVRAPAIQEGFGAVFRGSDPRRRPSALFWRQALDHAIDLLYECNDCGAQIIEYSEAGPLTACRCAR